MRFFLGVLFLGAFRIFAESAAPVAGDPLTRAWQLIDDGLPTIALAKLESISSEDLPEPERERLNLLKGRALLLAGRPLEASRILERAGEAQDALFLRAESAAAAAMELAAPRSLSSAKSAGEDRGQLLARAAEFYERAADAGGDLAGEARLGQARMLSALGSPGAAMEILRGQSSEPGRMAFAAALIDAGNFREAFEVLDRVDGGGEERQLLLARATAGLGDNDGSLKILRKIRDAKPPLDGEVALEHARLALLVGNAGEAVEVLEAAIGANPRSRSLGLLFDAFDAACAALPAPAMSAAEFWSEDPANPARSTRAFLTLGKVAARIGETEEAARHLQTFLDRAGEGDPGATDARAVLSSLALAEGDATKAWEAVSSGSGPQLDFARGLAKAASGDYAAAAEFFGRAEEAGGWEAAKKNRLLCEALAGDPGTGGDLSSRAARAMLLAGQDDPRALDQLEGLVREGKAGPAVQLAIAELYADRGRLQDARAALTHISNPDPSTAEQAAALAVFAQDDGSAGAGQQVLSAAERFVREYPDSPARPAVEMKWGEVLFRRGDYLSARERFTAVAENPAATSLSEPARFMAAQSASRSLDPAGMEEAIELYEEVARGGGDLASRARLAQALLLNAMKRPDEATALLDSLLATDVEDPIRLAALVEKGDALFARGSQDPDFYRKAIATWRLAATPDAPPQWRNQALVKIGTASEALGETSAALASYHDALDPTDDGAPEFFWSYKAGFDAARLLESLDRFEEAAALYSRLARGKGPRAEEARQRLSRLQLENFLWEEPEPVTESVSDSP